jgi:hypothetical protein
MAAKSALLPLLRRLSRPYLSIQKAPLLSSLQSRLFHASTEPLQSMESDALFILLVEKDAAFMRLAEDRF